ncbi:hypothetical protein [Halorubellus salinus]|uniref:hypothetical protein n=1 Tax=Halorubellus salinus TaxID=755309 RepID=UPI001D06D40C|nr:hypothetical protein [Halorubellus salinus]
MRLTHQKRITLALAFTLLLALAAGFADDALGYDPEHVDPAKTVPPSAEYLVDVPRADPTAADSSRMEPTATDPTGTNSTEAVAGPTDPAALDALTNGPNLRDTPSNDTHEIAFTHAHATVTLDCAALEMTVYPADVSYDLVLTYVDTSTGRFHWMAVGPLNGTVVDPFGETDFRLVEMAIQASGDPWVGVQTATVFGPGDCDQTAGGSTNDAS